MMARSVVDEIAAEIANRQAPLRWFQRVAPEHVATLAEIREGWLAGKFGGKRRPAARIISKWLSDHGIAQVGEQGVEEWLQRA